MVYSECLGSRSEAMRREKYFKTGRGREELKLLLETRFNESGRRGDKSQVQILSPR